MARNSVTMTPAQSGGQAAGAGCRPGLPTCTRARGLAAPCGALRGLSLLMQLARAEVKRDVAQARGWRLAANLQTMHVSC